VDVVHPRVAGIDVHKKVIWVAVRLPGQGPGERSVTVRRFSSFWRSLQAMAAWLAELGVAPPPVRPLPVGEVAPGVAVQGPVPGLDEQVRELHRRFRSPRG